MSEYSGLVTRNGRVTIPAELRRALNLNAGDVVSFTLHGVIVRIRRAEHVVARTAGALKTYRQGPPLSIQEERAAFEQGVADEVIESMHR